MAHRATTRSTPPQQVAAEVRARLRSQPDILVAYLFGSQARGTASPRSDTDVAVLLEPASDLARRRAELAAVLGSAVDLVILNDAPLALAYRVVRDGVILVCRDDTARIDHWVRTVDRYLDTAPLRQTLAEGQRRRLQEGRFGRP